MSQVLIFCPYFGKLPKKQVEMWLKTCSYSNNVNFMLFIDDKTNFNFPSNVKVIYTNLEELKNKFQKKFDFEIYLDHPYKLCDYKPCYGYLFNEYLTGYDYWGHIDFTDSILGDLDSLLVPLLEQKPDKVGFLGHLTLYRNNKENNEMFFNVDKIGLSLKDILGTKEQIVFDECFIPQSINSIYIKKNINIKFFNNNFFDVDPDYKFFRRHYIDNKYNHVNLNANSIIEWNNGKLYEVYIENSIIVKRELIYAHYQKRKIKFCINFDTNHFVIVPNKVIKCNSITKRFILKYTYNKIRTYNFNKKRVVNKIKRFLKK